MLLQARDPQIVQALEERGGADEFQGAYRRYVELVAERLAQSNWPVMNAAVVVKGMQSPANCLGEVTVIDESRGGPAVFERHRVQERLHGRAGLTWGSDGVVAHAS